MAGDWLGRTIAKFLVVMHRPYHLHSSSATASGHNKLGSTSPLHAAAQDALPFSAPGLHTRVRHGASGPIVAHRQGKVPHLGTARSHRPAQRRDQPHFVFGASRISRGLGDGWLARLARCENLLGAGHPRISSTDRLTKHFVTRRDGEVRPS